MTPKEKAIEIRHKYIFTIFQVNEDYEDVKNKLLIQAKHFALIAVDEIIKYTKEIIMIYDLSFDVSDSYWIQVKQEIEKL
jgi:hypothetical protein